MKKSMKKVLVGVMACAMMLSVGSVSMAKSPKADKPATKTETTATKPQKVSKVTCTAAGFVNISFKGKVAYGSEVTATITNKDGVNIPCSIKSKNKSLIKVAVKGLVKGETYTLKLEGVKGIDSEETIVVEKTFVAKGMKTQCKATKVKRVKDVLTLKLNTSATYKDATVSVVDQDGKEYEAKIIKKAKGNIKVKVTGLEKGKTYTVTVTGIKTKREKNFSSVTKKFVVK